MQRSGGECGYRPVYVVPWSLHKGSLWVGGHTPVASCPAVITCKLDSPSGSSGDFWVCPD